MRKKNFTSKSRQSILSIGEIIFMKLLLWVFLIGSQSLKVILNYLYDMYCLFLHNASTFQQQYDYTHINCKNVTAFTLQNHNDKRPESRTHSSNNTTWCNQNVILSLCFYKCAFLFITWSGCHLISIINARTYPHLQRFLFNTLLMWSKGKCVPD